MISFSILLFVFLFEFLIFLGLNHHISRETVSFENLHTHRKNMRSANIMLFFAFLQPQQVEDQQYGLCV